MTSTVKVNNLRKVSESADRDISGVAAAWVNFNQTGTATINDSVNISSLTDAGTGASSLDFTNSFANTSYCMSSGSLNSGTRGTIMTADETGARSASGTGNFYSIMAQTTFGAADDSDNCNQSFHGDLA